MLRSLRVGGRKREREVVGGDGAHVCTGASSGIAVRALARSGVTGRVTFWVLACSLWLGLVPVVSGG